MLKYYLKYMVFVSGLAIILYIFNIRFCPFFNVFHIPCPGCGLTRSFINLFKGNIKLSLEYNILPIIFIIIFIIFLILLFIKKEEYIKKLLEKYKILIITLSVVLLIIVWIININNPLLY